MRRKGIKVQPLSGQVLPLQRLRWSVIAKQQTVNFWNAHGKEQAGQGTVSFVRAATRLELPTPRPAGVASLKRPEGNTFYPYLHKRKGFEHEKK